VSHEYDLSNALECAQFLAWLVDAADSQPKDLRMMTSERTTVVVGERRLMIVVSPAYDTRLFERMPK
jgi:hypothetical protein